MLSNNQSKLIRSLRMKKFRTQHGLFLAEGDKLATELLAAKWPIHSLYAVQGWIDEHTALLQAAQVTALVITEKELAQVSQLSTPNQVLVVAELAKAVLDAVPPSGQLSLALENVQDPGNLGTIIRIADWFGITDIFCSEGSADVFNHKVVQATMGSILRVRVHYVNLSAVLTVCKLPIYGAVLNGENIYTANLTAEGVILMGNESAGLSSELDAVLTSRLAIPQFGGAESLNVAVATGVICSEFRRRVGAHCGLR